ncbi:MAG: energy-coupling factor transporter transmembrane component T [Candidatus Limnocylindrales bacterium]|jgi:energy-coupling factor transport system permease protein
MSLLPPPIGPVRPALLTRVTPVARLVAGLSWLVVSILTLDPTVPARLAVAAVLALVLWSGLPLRRIPGRLAPLGFAIVSLTVFSILLSGSNADRSLSALAELGPIRITAPAVSAGLAIGLRVVVIGLTTLLVFGPSDPTRMADSLVQQWHVPDRFAYGTLAAVRVAPFMAGDWTVISAARRLRGLQSGGVAGRIGDFGGKLMVMLVSAIRRAERLALAMDARGFDSGVRRTHFRELRVAPRDWLAIVVAWAVAAGALALSR